MLDESFSYMTNVYQETTKCT